jgi:hypothetical protein
MPSITGQNTPSGFDPGANPPIRFGVWGDSGDGAGVLGSSAKTGIGGPAGTPGGAGVFGLNDEFRGLGVTGRANADTGIGVLGTSAAGTGVVGTSASGVGLRASGGQAAAELDGDVRVSANLTAGAVGVNVATGPPSHPLDVRGNRGIRQNLLHLSGGAGWSSLSYNAHHNETNDQWVFPDSSRPAVTVEMDDSQNRPRFQLFSTTAAAPQAWRLLLAVDGTTGAVQVPNGAITPAVGDRPTAGVQFPTDPGGGAGDSAYIRYMAEAGEQTALIIGCENDANDRIVMRQNLRETLVLSAGRVGVLTRDPAFELDVNGTACARLFCNPSDARLKADVTSLTDVLERLADVRGVSFADQADTDGSRRRRCGVVAQDVEPAFPELIVPMADGDLKAVDYGGFVGVLVAAVNELTARTERLTRELASLRAASAGATP